MSKRKNPDTSSIAYRHFVDNPRYGREPQWSSWTPPHEMAVHEVDKASRIPGTAIPVDPSLYQGRIIRRTPGYYLDCSCNCTSCKRPFIFFAAEQKYWFETLGFHADARAVRCAECRKIVKASQEVQSRYVELSHLEPRRPEQDLEWLELYCALPGIKSSALPEQVLNRLAKLPEIDSARLEECRRILKP